MAVPTVSNPLELFANAPTHGGGSYILGHRIPDNVRFLQSNPSITFDGYTVYWIGDEKSKVHQLEVYNPITEESIITLLTAMRMSC